jgi:hypothetical protein
VTQNSLPDSQRVLGHFRTPGHLLATCSLPLCLPPSICAVPLLCSLRRAPPGSLFRPPKANTPLPISLVFGRVPLSSVAQNIGIPPPFVLHTHAPVSRDSTSSNFWPRGATGFFFRFLYPHEEAARAPSGNLSTLSLSLSTNNRHAGTQHMRTARAATFLPTRLALSTQHCTQRELSRTLHTHTHKPTHNKACVTIGRAWVKRPAFAPLPLFLQMNSAQLLSLYSPRICRANSPPPSPATLDPLCPLPNNHNKTSAHKATPPTPWHVVLSALPPRQPFSPDAPEFRAFFGSPSF